MDDRIYFTLALLIAAMVLGDFLLNSGDASLFLVRKVFDLVEALAFWRH